ncbi:cysteine synthase A [Fluoribacter gormanii]|uniref:cysteine synthase A n=1 Tax=Fluoribacter gormanii TaxID=464 RepID=UPI0010418BD8|nr:cysteine synthase A [Fluoribacter gormanii]
MRIYNSITHTIGNTPLIKLQHMNENLYATLLLKLEFFNPLGSVKDRIGIGMIEQAERDGRLKKGTEIVEPTSGNTGISLAFICATKKYPLTLIMPETMSLERRILLLMMGAKIILTPGALGMRGAIAKANELKAINPSIFIPSQFENPANPAIHKETTALEIWHDTDGMVDMIVGGVGTGGTISAIGEVLKAKKASLQIIAVEPEESAVISGNKPGSHKIQGIGAGFIPKNLNLNYVDKIEQVSSNDAIGMARKVIREEGIPVGISSGAALVAAFRQAEKACNKGKTIVAIIPSCTERYLSTALVEQEREMAQNLEVHPVDERFFIKAVSDKL